MKFDNKVTNHCGILMEKVQHLSKSKTKKEQTEPVEETPKVKQITVEELQEENEKLLQTIESTKHEKSQIIKELEKTREDLIAFFDHV